MHTAFRDVLRLQGSFSSTNTVAMQRRGVLIRQEIPDALRAVHDRLAPRLGPYGKDLAFEGRDGTGRKTLVPWVRFHSKAFSPSAQVGWYCVYLFQARGERVYLCLIHGSTVFRNGEFHARPATELHRLVRWAREINSSALAREPSLGQPVKLDGGGLAAAYEISIALSRTYHAAALPPDDALFADAEEFAGYLREIYDAERVGPMPTVAPPEVLDIEMLVADRPSHRQGFGLTPAERRAVELRAMIVARAHLEANDWYVRNTSVDQPYDFECLRGGVRMIVEVKGTTSKGEAIVLTRNEVAAHRERQPNNALIVVHSIVLRPGGGVPSAEGGLLAIRTPWTIDDSDLTPIAYQYNVGAT